MSCCHKTFFFFVEIQLSQWFRVYGEGGLFPIFESPTNTSINWIFNSSLTGNTFHFHNFPFIGIHVFMCRSPQLSLTIQRDNRAEFGSVKHLRISNPSLYNPPVLTVYLIKITGSV
jgi:hypothetical protein